jgi:hypothetical protein
MKRKSENSASIYGRDVHPRKCLFCESTYPEWWRAICGSSSCRRAWEDLLKESAVLYPHFSEPSTGAFILYEERMLEAEHLTLPTEWDHLNGEYGE